MQMWQGVVYRADGTIKGAFSMPRIEDIYSQADTAAGEVAYPVPDGTLYSVPWDLARVRTYLKAKVDAEAEAARERFMTPGAGQAMEYLGATEEARAYAADPGGTYPLLLADVDAGTIDPRTGSPVATVAEAADLVMFMFNAWKGALATIRQARLGAKASITTAADIPAM